MRNLSLSASIILVLLFMVACHKNDGCVDYTANSDAQKSFYSFQTGSYWIMRDSVTGMKDSIVAKSNLLGTYEIQPSSGCLLRADEKRVNFDVYNGSTDVKDTNITFSMDFRGIIQYFEFRDYAYDFGSIYNFPIVNNVNNISVNGNLYNSASLADYATTIAGNNVYMKTITNQKYILLSIDYIDKNTAHRWRLESPHIIR